MGALLALLLAQEELLRTYCVSCHGAKAPKGELNLTAPGSSSTWQAVLQQLEDGEMPPKKKDVARPSPEERARLIAWVKGELRRVSGDVGRATRRLNRAEYGNTIRDLLFIDDGAGDTFPLDLGLGGFDNIAEAQSVSPFLMEKYVAAARESIARAIARGPEPKPVRVRGFPMSDNQRRGKVPVKPSELDDLIKKPFHLQGDAGRQFFSMDWTSHHAKDGNGFVREGQGPHGYEVVLPHNGMAVHRAEMWFQNELPVGRYRHQARAYAELDPGREQTGSCVMAWFVNGRRVGETTVEVGAEPKVYELEFTTDRRHNKVVVAAASRLNKKDLPGVPRLVLGEGRIDGPLYDAWPPPSHRAIFGEDGKDAVEDILRRFVSRAFRRPARPEDVAKYAALAERELAAGATREDAVAAALVAVLVSPRFLFLIEADGRLEPAALASRLSYFLWSSMPDEALLRSADPAAEVARMLRDPKAVALVENFAALWIGLRRIHDLTPDPRVFKDWDEDLRQAMREEPARFFEHVLRENLSVLTFLDSDFTFVNERLARHYGLPGVKGGEFRKVALRPEDHRGGLLTQAAVLTLGAQPTRASPVFRGKFVFEKLFNRPPPNPPPDIPALEEKAASKSPASLREQLALHARDPKCAACHVKIDPWGLPLQGFDGIGAWKGASVEDLTSVFEDGRTITGEADLRQELLIRKDEFVRGLAEKLMMYALGRSLRFEDKEAIPAIVARTRDDGYRFQTLIREIVLSAPFRTR